MSLWRRLLGPLTPIYGAVVRWKRRMFESGRLRTKRLGHPVISVGSISAGGAGKTPMTLLMAEMLQREGFTVRILTRGYGRRGKEVERVDPEGPAGWFGDEPVLLARRSGTPVYVGADRYRAGVMAEELPARGPVVFLLDDGFQHGRLERAMDVVLLTRADAEDRLLPAGNLREPLSALGAADVIAVREEEAESLREFLGTVRGRAAIWRIRRRLLWGEIVRPERPVVFTGIARPEGFFGMVEAAGVRAAATVRFGDHHRYRDRDIAGLLRRAAEAGADGWVTTEKDAVKLTGEMRRRLEAVGPVAAPELRVELLDEAGALELIRSMLGRARRR